MSDESAAVAAPNADTAEKLREYEFISSDKIVCRISELAIKQSKTLNELIVNMGYTDEDSEEKAPIPLYNISGDILKIIFKWCEHHKREPVLETIEDVSTQFIISEFDEKLMDIEDMQLYHLICAADYLEINQLLMVSCKKVSNMAKGKTAAELRAIFGIPTNEEDEAAVAGQAVGGTPNEDAREEVKNA